jgi:pimeloyl-ACP methyl ester carboxylesterase
MTVALSDPPLQSLKLADGRTLTWQEFGQPGGRPVLYCHGGGSNAREAGIFHREAVAQGLRLISTNRPGAGGSSLKPGRPIAAYADDIAALLDHLGVARFACFGESNGGAVTLAIASALAGRVIGAVPINPTLPWHDPLARKVSPRGVAFGYWLLKHAPWACELGARSAAANYRKRAKADVPAQRPTARDSFGPPPGAEEDVGEILVSLTEGTNLEALRPELAWATADWGFDYYNVPTRLDFFCGVVDAQAPFALVLADINPDARFHYFSWGHHGFVHPDARRRIVETVAGYFA